MVLDMAAKAKIKLTEAFRDVALQLQEQATAMSHDDIRTRISSALDDVFNGTGYYSYLVAVFGDDTSGNCVYSLCGDLKRCPYAIAGAKCTVDTASAIDVQPLTTYEPEVTQATEAGARNSKRDLTQLQSIHDAAAKLGAKCGDDASEAAADVELTGDIIPLKEGAVGQDGTAYLKLIAPGWGSSGYYSEAVLQRDGPKVFKSGTKNFWNHQTDAEEAARPEGDLRDLASTLTEDAHYETAGPTGPGLYAKAEVQPSFRAPVDSLAKHIGMSIRASGKAREGKAPDGKSGVIIEQLTSGKSVDYVTTPGAGGQILQLFEAARGAPALPPIPQQESEPMPLTAAEETQLREAAQQGIQALTEVTKFKQREALRDVAEEYFETVTVKEAVRKRVIARIAEAGIPADRAAIKAAVERETKDECAYLETLAPSGRVHGLSAPASAAPTEEQKEAKKRDLKEASKRFASVMGIRTKEGRRILDEGATAFDPNYHAPHPDDAFRMKEAS